MMGEFGNWKEKGESRCCQMGLTPWKKTFLNFGIQWLFGEMPDVTSSWS